MALPLRSASPARAERSSSEILQAARAADGRAGAFLIGGGDLFGRADVWQLLAELVRLRPAGLGVSSNGQSMNDALVQRLRSVGVERVHVPFHCARQDAHDWLVGQPGALKTAHRAIRACIDAQIPVTAEIVLTRPTTSHLPETVEVLARLGVRSLCIRRLTANDADGPEFVSLSPRLDLLGESLEKAAALALQRRVRLVFRDLPLCAAPQLGPLFAAPDSELWILPDGSVRPRAEVGPGCATCPGPPECIGAPRDYTARFGWEEFVDPSSTMERVHENVASQRAPRPSQPMVFTWRGPHRVRCEACADVPADRPNAAPEDSRVVRALMVQAARFRPSALRLVGADLLGHPQAAAFLYDAVRLFPHVEVAGEASAVVEWSDLDLRRMKDLRRIDVALYGPDAASHDAHCGIPGAFSAMLRAVQRLRQTAKIPVGAYAILHDARPVPAFAELWAQHRLPGEPRFRLSARGSSLDELVRVGRELPDGPVRSALQAVLPHCLWQPDESARGAKGAFASQQALRCGRAESYQPCGSDPIGAFEACEKGMEWCNVPGCPGTAVGWQSTARSKRWTVNS